MKEPVSLLSLWEWALHLRNERFPLIEHLDKAQNVFIGLIRLCIVSVETLPICIDFDAPGVKGKGPFCDNEVSQCNSPFISCTDARHRSKAGLILLQHAWKMQSHLLRAIAREPGDVKCQHFPALVRERDEEVVIVVLWADARCRRDMQVLRDRFEKRLCFFCQSTHDTYIDGGIILVHSVLMPSFLIDSYDRYYSGRMSL